MASDLPLSGVVDVVGGGLAGCEAAYQLAARGIPVRLWEMRPTRQTGAHETDALAEIVCSNSLGSDRIGVAGGALKAELRRLGCLLLEVAGDCRVPAGSALAVDRARFTDGVRRRLDALEGLEIVRDEVLELSALGGTHTILASGPLTSPALSDSLQAITGAEHLFFHDAIAPIVSDDSLDHDALFLASRREPDAPGDYLNIPLERDDYERFVDQLLDADRVVPHAFENERLFDACQPIESIAARGRDSLRFGPMRPIGLTDPRTGRTPYAVVQLRAENVARTAWGLVGFQTRLRHPEQAALLRTLPGLADASFLRLGSIHRNTFLDAPTCLDEQLRLRAAPSIRVAGQLAGCEGYVESIALGLMAALWTAAELRGQPAPPTPPDDAIVGGLLRYLRDGGPGKFAPMNANFGLVPPLSAAERRIGKRKLGRRERREAMGRRALAAADGYVDALLDTVGRIGDSPAVHP